MVKQTPDARGRIGVRVNCLSAAGCKLELILSTAGAKPTELGRVYTQLIGGSGETDYVMLTKRKLAVIAKQPKTAAVFDASVTVGGASAVSYTKPVTLRAPTSRRRP